MFGMKSYNDPRQLLNMLEETRAKMIQIGIKYGLAHPKTLEASNKIDQLHNNYNQIMNKNNEG